MAKETYEFDFSYDDGKWNLTNANIAGGLLNVALIPWSGSGNRTPESNWGRGANDNFEIEAKFRRKIKDTTPEIASWWTVTIALSGYSFIQFIHDTYDNKLKILVDGDVVVSQYQDMNDINWHSIKIRRMGTIYYLSADGESELNYNYGIPKAIEEIGLAYKHSMPEENNGGEYDDFKYSWWPRKQDQAFIM